MAKIIPQSYPRIDDPNNIHHGCLDDMTLVEHIQKIPVAKMNEIIKDSITNAELKSGREILNIPENVPPEQINTIYINEGKKLFNYFIKYYGDPAATAHQLYKQCYKDVAVDQFRIRTLQKERMNSGWRYQFLAFESAKASQRFRSVSDIGAAEADFNAVVEYKNQTQKPLSLYVSIKNRTNTMGGQDWPKAIQALEQVASTDKNRLGSYICVFGMAMDKSKKARLIKTSQKTKLPYSANTEIWYANYFWPFFSNYEYEEIMSLVLDVLLTMKSPELSSKIDVPETLIESFGNECKKNRLLNLEGFFDDPHKLVELFCKKDK